MLCDYGCGHPGKYQFKNGKWCCSKTFSGCSFIIKKQNESRLLKNKKNKDNILCKFGCDIIGKYINKNEEWCCSSHHTKCPTYRLFVKNNNPMNNSVIKEKHKYKMKTLTGKNNPLYTCEGALERHKKSQRTIETRQKKSISTLKAVEKGIHPSHIDTLKEYKQKYPLLLKIEELKEDNNGNIFGRCKNNKCTNSKEQGGWFKPSNGQLKLRSYYIKDGYDNGYFYCSEKCKHECSIFGKSPNQLIREDKIRAGHIEDSWYNSSEYQTWRNQVFKLDNSKCVWCGTEATIVHHILPQKTYPNLSLDPENGLSCCQECHMKYGHRDRWCTTGFLAGLVCERIIRIKNKI